MSPKLKELADGLGSFRGARDYDPADTIALLNILEIVIAELGTAQTDIERLKAEALRMPLPPEEPEPSF